MTLIHRLQPGTEAPVSALLNSDRFGDCVRDSAKVHFLRLLIIDSGTPEARVVFCGDFDSPVEQTFAELVVHCREPLGELWAHCEGFPDTGTEDSAAFADFVASGHQSRSYRFSAYPQASVQQIRQALDWMHKTARYQIELAKLPRPY